MTNRRQNKKEVFFKKKMKNKLQQEVSSNLTKYIKHYKKQIYNTHFMTNITDLFHPHHQRVFYKQKIPSNTSNIVQPNSRQDSNLAGWLQSPTFLTILYNADFSTINRYKSNSLIYLSIFLLSPKKYDLPRTGLQAK